MESWRNLPTQTSAWCSDEKAAQGHSQPSPTGRSSYPREIWHRLTWGLLHLLLCCCFTGTVNESPFPAGTDPAGASLTWSTALQGPGLGCAHQSQQEPAPCPGTDAVPRNPAGAVLELACSKVVLVVSLPASKLENTVQTLLLLNSFCD